MKSNYDGSEYGQVTVGRGKSVHFGNVEENMTACGKRGYLQDASGHEVTCKVCVKMAETTHDGSAPLIRNTPKAWVEDLRTDPKPSTMTDDEIVDRFGPDALAPVETSVANIAQAFAQTVTTEHPAIAAAAERNRARREHAAAPVEGADTGAQTTQMFEVRPGQVWTSKKYGTKHEVSQRADDGTSWAIWGPSGNLYVTDESTFREMNNPPAPTQTFEVTYLAPRTGTQRVETVEATTVHAVPVEPRDAEVLLSIYLVSKETALLNLTAATIAGIRQVDPNY